MAITNEQRDYRAGRIGSSDAKRIMLGDWRDLWLEKTGRAVPACLDFVPAVQIGIATEHLHLKFWTRQTGIAAIPADGKTYIHPAHDWLVAHLDFLTWQISSPDPFAAPDTILEAKFCGSPKTDDELAMGYFWQLQHQMLVTGFPRSVLSILRPSSYSWLPVARDEAAIATLLDTLKAFWWHVEKDIEPGDPMPIAAPDLEGARVIDMSLHNAFAAHAATLLSTRKGMQAYRMAEAELKAMMPEDARIAFIPAAQDGDGLHLSRSRDGRITLRFGRLPRHHARHIEHWRPVADYDTAE